MAAADLERALVETLWEKECRRRMARIRRMRNGGGEFLDLAGSLHNGGTLHKVNLLNIGNYDATSMNGAAASGPMHHSHAMGPVELASVRVAAPAGLGQTLVPWARMTVALTPSTVIVVMPVGVIRVVLGAPPTPTRFVHLLHRGAGHLDHLALLANAPVLDAVLAHTGMTSAVIMNQGLAVLWTTTGSCPGKSHPRGCTCRTCSMTEVRPRGGRHAARRTSTWRAPTAPAAAKETIGATRELGLRMITTMLTAAARAELEGGGPRLGSAPRSGRAMKRGWMASAAVAAA